MRLEKINHVAIIVSDYEKSREFYVEKLGFTVLRENYRPEKDDYKLDLQVGEMELELFGVKNPPKRVNHPEACGLRHLSFQADDIEKMVQELEEKGIKCEPIRMDETVNKPFTFFFDPDGLPLELHG